MGSLSQEIERIKNELANLGCKLTFGMGVNEVLKKEFEERMFPINKYKFYVARKVNGDPYKVYAVSTYAGKTVRGSAKCDPRDEFDLEKGKMLAAARCETKVAEKRWARAELRYQKSASAMLDARAEMEQSMDYLINSRADYLKAEKNLKSLLAEM